MFYATAGQQATQQPPASRGVMGAFGRSGPPGFGGRGSADPNDFPALGSHPQQHNSTYAAQAQPSQPSTASSQQQQQQQQAQQQQNPHLQQQQQLFLQQQQLGVAPPPPPPGISGPAGAGSGQANGALGDDFPALGGGADGKDGRLSSYLRNPSNPAQLGQPSSPSSNALQNGSVGTGIGAPSASQSSNATPSTNPPHPRSGTGGPPSTADSSWPRQPSPRSSEPVVRPVQQILSSPVDKWGLKALLYEIQMHMNKTDRGMLIFGEDLAELGVDVNSEEPLYPSFVTPWADPSSLSQPPRIEESFHIPQCYNVHAPPVETKLPNFAEDTLFFAFYMSPQDILQLEVAEELYTRGWRYHTELQLWLTSPTLPSIDLSKADVTGGQPNWIRGPFMYLDTRTWTKQRTAEDFTIDANVLEVTRRAEDIVREENVRKEVSVATKSPNGNAGMPVQGQGQLPYQR
ncbi:hypothetical protein IAR55_001094 [Kwoniella newhampshirensis]|uniref:NOT2/NOT3/NOT5 C-terminal domain-containing protein n=1 Tax=Kwoniella newhampshirensis TaxID=1651941 RepID=A0AAW0Z4M6_9TREE